jgi:hypothetical protein
VANTIYTVDNLLTSLKNRGLPPTSQSTFTTDQFIQILSEEMQSNIVPLIDSVSEEYFVSNVDVDFDPTVTEYNVPARAVGGKLRDLVFLDANGNEIGIPRLRPEDIKVRGYFPVSVNYGFYMRGGKVVIWNGVNGTNNLPNYPTLRFKIIRRPNILTAAANCGQVLSFNVDRTIVTLSNAGTTWADTDLFDIISNTPMFAALAEDLEVDSIAGFDVTFTDPVPDTVQVGDWVALANYSPIPQIPVEAFMLLAQFGAAKVLESMGDVSGMNAALKKADKLTEKLMVILTPRVEGSVIKLASRGGIADSEDSSLY